MVTARVKQPAARAASRPFGASSTTRQCVGSTPIRCAATRNGSGCGLPWVTSSAVTSTEGATRSATLIRASARGTVQEVAIAFFAPASAARASAAPGRTTIPSRSASSSALIRSIAAACRSSGSTARTTLAAGMPWWTSSSFGANPYSVAQVDHDRMTAGVESMSVPSMSKITPSKTWSANRPSPPPDSSPSLTVPTNLSLYPRRTVCRPPVKIGRCVASSRCAPVTSGVQREDRTQRSKLQRVPKGRARRSC